MPYRSAAQRAFMHAKHPGIAAKWDKEHPANARAELPAHVKQQSRQPRGQGGGGRWAGYTASPELRRRS